MGNDFQKQLEQAALKYIKRVINETLETEVAPTVRNILRRNIQSEVLNKDFGGSKQYNTNNFNKPENIKTYFDKDNMSFMMRNETKPKSIFNTPIESQYESIFGYWIEVGSVPVLWDNGNPNYVNKRMEFVDKNGKTHIIEKAFPPRPYMAKTKESLKNNPQPLINALKRGLKRRGLSK